MVKAAMKGLKTVTQPILIMHSREDDHANLNNATYLQRALGGIVDMVVLNDSYHMITLDKQRQVVVDQTRTFVDRVVNQIQKLAVTSVPVSPFRKAGLQPVVAV